MSALIVYEVQIKRLKRALAFKEWRGLHFYSSIHRMPAEADRRGASNQSGRRNKAFKRFVFCGIFLWVSRLLDNEENQAKAKESDLSDTLSPSKEKSSDDATDAQMDEQDLNEPLAKVSLLKDDSQGAQSEIEAKQEIQHLRKELIEAQELARASKQKCFELQALLEEERKAYRNQIEESTKQIQVLQAQLQRLHINIENLREEKDSEITSTRDELLSARDEILLLHQAAEKAASERDTDITSLQEELKKVRGELERWRKAASEYEKEITSLQNSFQLRCQQCEDQQREEATRLQGELEKLRKEWKLLETECHSLKKENVLLSSELQRQEKELHNSQKQSLELTSDLGILQMTRKELENQMGSLKEQHLRDSTDLKTLLSKAENQAKDVQKEYEKTQTVLSELKLKFEMTEQEKQSITDELKQCKDNLKLLREKGNNKPWPWMPMLAALVAVTAIVLYVPGLARASP
ncbi:PREDICTED: sarcolemmal membrane-associated protein isoform X15 [Myotis brandtii]|uniref:sarcolemmal membrane-associated protein isoform X15 n=1 Tax=Myotis brandtii TaxID=109478 RepID=UPI0007040E9B|nr:PREDICTED: sarcolemmal membrane-associated protein isoform X15 [Myotis brandtii]